MLNKNATPHNQLKSEKSKMWRNQPYSMAEINVFEIFPNKVTPPKDPHELKNDCGNHSLNIISIFCSPFNQGHWPFYLSIYLIPK